MKRAILIAVLAAAMTVPTAEAHNATAKLGYRSTILAVKPPMPGLQWRAETSGPGTTTGSTT